MALKLTEEDARRLGIGAPKRKASGKNVPTVSRSRRQASSSKSPPQDKLWNALKWDPNTRGLPWQWEFSRAVPGRRFSIDIALVLSSRHKLALEVDGMRHHGISRDGFYRDREKDFLLEANFWRVVRIPAGMILKDLAGVLDRVTVVARQLEGQYLRDRLDKLPAGYSAQWQALRNQGFPDGELTFSPLPSRAGWFHRHHSARNGHGGCHSCHS